MVRKKGKKSIKEVLKKRKSSLGHQLEKIWQRAQESYELEFNRCIEIEENLDVLIEDDDKSNMTDEQLFILSTAACLNKLNQAASSEEEIYKAAIDLNLTENQAKVLCKITGSHKSKDFNNIPSTMFLDKGVEVKDIPLLAALFKLATILPNLDKDASINKGWKYSGKDENLIIYEFLPKQEKDYKTIFTQVEQDRKELIEIAKILRGNGYPYMINPVIDENNIIFNLGKERKGKLDIGMNCYGISESDIFRGRDKDIEKLIILVKENPICLLTSECGRGKSSLIQAGLLPSLRREGWRFAYVRPDSKVKILNQLKSQMLPDAEGISSMEKFLQKLSEKYFQTNIIIALDQFECLVDPTFSSEDADEFAKGLTNIGRFPYIRFLIAYRSDFEGKLRYLWNEIADDPRGLPCLPLGPLAISDTADALKYFFEANQVKTPNAEVLQIIAKDLFKESTKITQGRGVFPPFIQMVAEALRNYVRDTKKSLTNEIYTKEMGRAYGIIGFYLKAMVRQVKEDTYIGRTVLYCLVNQMGEREYRYLIAGKSYE